MTTRFGPATAVAIGVLLIAATANAREILLRAAVSDVTLTTDGSALLARGTLRSLRSGRFGFDTTSQAVARVAGGDVEIIARTGDAPPSPLNGRFATFSSIAIAPGGDVVFVADVGGRSALLHYGPAGMAVRIPELEQPPSGLAINQRSDVVLWGVNDIGLWEAGAQRLLTIATVGGAAPNGAAFTWLPGRPAIDANGAVTFPADFERLDGTSGRGLFRWALAPGGAHALSIVATDEAQPVSWVPIAIEPGGALAYVGGPDDDLAIFTVPPDGNAPTRIAGVGDVVDDAPLLGIGAFIAIDSGARVSFMGRFADGEQLVRVAAGVQTRVGPLFDSGDASRGVWGLADDGAMVGRAGDRLVRLDEGDRSVVADPQTAFEGRAVVTATVAPTGSIAAWLERRDPHVFASGGASPLVGSGEAFGDLSAASVWGSQQDARGRVTVGAFSPEGEWFVGERTGERRRLLARGRDVTLEGAPVVPSFVAFGDILDSGATHSVVLLSDLSGAVSAVLAVGPSTQTRWLARSDGIPGLPTSTAFTRCVVAPDGAIVEFFADGRAGLLSLRSGGTDRFTSDRAFGVFFDAGPMGHVKRPSFMMGGNDPLGIASIQRFTWKAGARAPRVQDNRLIPMSNLSRYSAAGPTVVAVEQAFSRDGSAPWSVLDLRREAPRRLAAQGDTLPSGERLGRIDDVVALRDGAVLSVELGEGADATQAIVFAGSRRAASRLGLPTR